MGFGWLGHNEGCPSDYLETEVAIGFAIPQFEIDINKLLANSENVSPEIHRHRSIVEGIIQILRSISKDRELPASFV